MRLNQALLLMGVSAVALATGARSQAPSLPSPESSAPSAAVSGRVPANTAETPEIVVTGSRVITNGNAAPTPVTVLSTSKLLETAPTNIPDALNRLPQFAASPSMRSIGTAGTNSTGSYLNLRQFGQQRNLILLDGSRVPPTASSGSVDTNLLPQAFVKRVEVVTGGASAVYGSDAITGVVNFVLDHDFNGLRFNSQYGISNYGDSRSYRVGAAAGTRLFDGRGHIEVSFDHYDNKGVLDVHSRPEGLNEPTVGGAGTADNPYRVIYNGRVLTGARGGLITGSNLGTTLPDGLRDITFKANGVPSQFVHGAPTGVAGLESGGDGSFYNQGVIAAPLRTTQAFGRFDFDLTDNIHTFVQGSYNTTHDQYPYFPVRLTNAILTGNPFIPASVQAAMTANNIQYINVSKFNDGRDDYAPRGVLANTRNIFIKTGLEGKIGSNIKWSVGYSFSRSHQYVVNINNQRAEKLAAATDAVLDPTGRIVCAVSLTPYASRFPGCEPVNLFGPTAVTDGAYDYVTDDTYFKLDNKQHDAFFAVSAQPFSLWAGPVSVSVNGEYRYLTLRNRSNADPGTPPDCTGLRNIGSNCTPTTPPVVNDSTAPVFAKQDVKEVGAELLIPLLKDLPLVRSLELNLAGRYTDYSTSGSVKTWKIGGTWQVIDGLRVRATASRDIRAPTLINLFQPTTSRATGFNDLHTQTSGLMNIFAQGNPDLVPEVARTNTVGVVFQPSFIPRFSIAIDAYEIKINNAITDVQSTDINVQRECENSNGTSPLCVLFERPLPFSDHSAANFPTRTYTLSLNAARLSTRGIDVEINYNFGLESLSDALPGEISLRGLVSYQPELITQTLPSLPERNAAGISGISKWRANLNVAYSTGGLNFSVVERWQSSQLFSDPKFFVDIRGKIPNYFYTDLSMSYNFTIRGHEVAPFVTLENVFNRRPPISGQLNATPGIFLPVPQGFDAIGRYATFGIRAKF